jgi:hypothetical protein
MTTFSVACADHDHPVCERLGCQCLCHRHATLLAALEALVTQWQETSAHIHRRAVTLDHVPASQSYDYGQDQAFAQCADALATVLATHREER